MTRLISLIVICLLLSCTNDSGTIKELEKRGYSEITTTGYRPFGCGFWLDKHYFTRTGFRAKKYNKIVTGCVCQGILGTTVKIDKD
jgi:hypothetical protein